MEGRRSGSRNNCTSSESLANLIAEPFFFFFFLPSHTILLDEFHHSYESLFRTRRQVGKREKRLEEFDIFPFPLAFPLALLPQSVDLTSCRSFTFDPSYRMWANFHSTLVDEGNAWCTCLFSPTHVGPPGDELSSCARQKSRPPGHLPRVGRT